MIHSDVVTIGLDAAVWVGWSALVGWRAAHWPAAEIARDGWLTTLRPAERHGDAYRRLGIRHWKRWVPDAGRFAGGRRKRLDRPLDPAEWVALGSECRRAERVHWLILLALPIVAIWTRGVLLAVMVVYAALANLPCIAIQRYNRARLASVAERRDRRAKPAGPD